MIKQKLLDIELKINNFFSVSMILAKYAFGLYFLLVFLFYIVISSFVEMEGTIIGNWILGINIFVTILLTVVFRKPILNFEKDFRKKKELQNQNKRLQEIEAENKPVSKGDLVKFEYETSTGSKFYSVKLIDIEFDANAEWGTFGVLIAETSKDKTRKFFDYSLMSEIIYKGKKYDSFEELHDALNR
ncbi:hypothetical protein [Rodentibacter haemolyticus]|uniref:Uncharacterized protein n=1 Tax=Rodentibacter haemolyticus TaxID=2778911 RepID=A0ABX6UZ39_9PAST|nr:hypothetical protein [Rodentibacter haemolyticus]QPB43039.1 hypothetical protein IHV77_02675 [Rodentibacter haemolyticus]